MKLKSQLMLGLSVLLALVLLLLSVGWYQLLSIHRISDGLRHDHEFSSLAHDIQRKVKDVAISLRNGLTFGDEALVREELDIVRSLNDAVLGDIQAMETMAVTAEQRVFVNELRTANRQYGDYLEETVALIAAGNPDEATRLVIEQGRAMQNMYFETISRMTDFFGTQMQSSIAKVGDDFERQMLIGSLVCLLGIMLAIAFVFRSVWRIALRLSRLSGVMLQVAGGSERLQTRIEADGKDEIDDVARAFNQMAESLEEQLRKEQLLSEANQEESWLKTHMAEIMTELSGTHETEAIARTFLSKVVPLLEACQAAFYVKDEEGAYRLIASYAFTERKHPINRFAPGEGLVGQAVLERSPILLTQVPGDYMPVRSGLGEAPPINIYVLPVLYMGDVTAVVEIASFIRFSRTRQALIDALADNLGIVIDSVNGRVRLARLLEQSQTMTEELQAQSEELQAQQEKLQYQQEELEQTNADLRDKAGLLEEQNKKLEATNREVEEARTELEEKASQLLLSSRYKSEFLANMSHELRTPLNSLLILSKLLVDNPEGNLSEKQLEFSSTIYSSGCDLLNIINDILDLAKVESGKLAFTPGDVYIDDLIRFAESSFKPVAAEKQLDFHIRLIDGAPRSLYSDEQKLQQILRNLLANAFKFTHKGEVCLEIGPVEPSGGRSGIYFAVSDTGIGIPRDKQELIFQAFQQADGTTSRKYGGTGLGLSISRQLSFALGGEVTVDSEVGKGSTFTFYVDDFRSGGQGRAAAGAIGEAAAGAVGAAASGTASGAATLTGAGARAGASATRADASADAPVTGAGARGFDAGSHIKRLLIVDDDLRERNSLMELIGDKDVILTAVSTGSEAMEEIRRTPYDCMVLDLGLSDTTGFELLERLKAGGLADVMKIIIYTGRDLTAKEEMDLKRDANASIIIKDAHSPERLLEELTLYLNAGSARPSAPKETGAAKGLAGKKVLLVDDDVRNVFALSNVLELSGMTVVFAENGVEGLKAMNSEPSIDIVLMDIMMPEMDGYETMRRLRANARFAQLPIIALTAKAMKEDRQLCIDAGASDYIVKPVESDQLLSLIRVWLYPNEA